MDSEKMEAMQEKMKDQMMGTIEYAESDEVFLYDPEETTIIHTNVFTEEYLAYVDSIDPEICSNIGYTRIVGMNILRDVNGTITPVAFKNPFDENQSRGSRMQAMTSMEGIGLSSYPKQLKEGEQSFLSQNYELLAGAYPESATDLVLVIDASNSIDFNILKNLGFDTNEKESIKFSEIVDTELRIISNDNFYVQTEFGSYLPGQDFGAMYAADNNINTKIVGVVRLSKDANVALLGTGIAYSDELAQLVIDNSIDSAIVKAQEASDKNVMTMEDMNDETKATFLAYLGGNATPYMMMVYPDNFEDKDAVLAYLDTYNEGKEPDDKVIYTDLAGTMSEMTGGILDGITAVLIAFAAISLFVSLIMICIITYTSVLERTKEIGILRALGARKKDITRVFDAETFLLGVFSGVLGVVISWLLTFPINKLLFKITELEDVAHLQLSHAILLVIISTVLTVLGGHIPARMASKKDAVEALRSE
jgi:putative ABC transport system permease protein